MMFKLLSNLISASYVLFSIGNVKPLFSSAFPACWGNNPTACNETWVQSVEYLEIVGIIIGQILVGIIGDWIGRRFGLIQDATIMFVGLLMLTASWGVTLGK
jgi:MFS family permease